MENWDAQKMLDLYIYNYLIKKNMHTTAEIFAREANIYPKDVAIDSPEGFLSEWWSVFWSIYSARCPEATQAPVDGPQNAHPSMTSSEAHYNVAMQSPGPSPQNWMAARMTDLGPPHQAFTCGPQLLNVNELPSSSNHSHLPEIVYKNPQLPFIRDDKCATNLRRFGADPLPPLLPSSSNFSLPQERGYTNLLLAPYRGDESDLNLWRLIIEERNCHPNESIQLNTRLVNTDVEMKEQESVAIAPMLPSSSNYSHQVQKKKKKRQRQRRRQHSPTQDDRTSGPSLRRSIDHLVPLETAAALEAKPSHEDGRIALSFKSQLVGVNQLARLLLSSTKFSEAAENDVDKKSQLSAANNTGSSASSN